MNEIELHLIPENNGWIQKISASLTEEQQAILDSFSKSPSSESTTSPDYSIIDSIFKDIKNRSEIPASTEDAAAAQAIFDSKFPNGFPATAKLIHAVITLPDGRGIINYRMSDTDHQQIRF